jgi:gliding motility-associated-like protein
MRKSILIGLFLLVVNLTKLFSSHIVGGEIEMAYIRGNIYQILLKMYVDSKNATAGVIASEIEARVGIYEKNTHKLMAKKNLPRRLNLLVNYDSACNKLINKPIETRALVFFENIELDPAVYNSPNGYYVVWGNCCRNIVIENIQNPFYEGMAFYTEFPALMKNGTRFYNSSPHFETIGTTQDLIGDFPCINKDFTFNFSGVDPNGDSLAYRMSTPLAGWVDYGGNAEPQPGPYDPVVWVSPYNVINQIPGNPALNVDPQTGQLRLRANKTGLFVFSVTIDEFRNGEKIGEVRRDFQFLVVNCEDNAPPAIALKLPDGSNYNSLTDTLSLRVNVDTCFTVLVSDSSTIRFNKSENLTVKIINSTLPAGVLSIGTSLSVSPGNDTTNTNACFRACDRLFIKKDTIFNLSLVVTDAPKCPMSLAYYDTLDVVVKYIPQINSPPIAGLINITGPVKATVGKNISFKVYGKDPDTGDIITLSANGAGFSLGSKDMSFPSVNGQDSITSTFSWTPDCEHAKEGGMNRVLFFADDNSCIPENMDTVYIDIFVEDTTTTLPFISPVNLFTPNDDSMNECFFIPNIPEGNCDYFFKKITIYNRWGAKIFDSEDPYFRWCGEDHPSGIYFYHIDINEKEFKGWINLTR